MGYVVISQNENGDVSKAANLWRRTLTHNPQAPNISDLQETLQAVSASDIDPMRRTLLMLGWKITSPLLETGRRQQLKATELAAMFRRIETAASPFGLSSGTADFFAVTYSDTTLNELFRPSKISLYERIASRQDADILSLCDIIYERFIAGKTPVEAAACLDNLTLTGHSYATGVSVLLANALARRIEDNGLEPEVSRVLIQRITFIGTGNFVPFEILTDTRLPQFRRILFEGRNDPVAQEYKTGKDTQVLEQGVTTQSLPQDGVLVRASLPAMVTRWYGLRPTQSAPKAQDIPAQHDWLTFIEPSLDTEAQNAMPFLYGAALATAVLEDDRSSITTEALLVKAMTLPSRWAIHMIDGGHSR